MQFTRVAPLRFERRQFVERNPKLTVKNGGRVIYIPKTMGINPFLDPNIYTPENIAKINPFPLRDPYSGWTVDSKRTGAIAVKIGMTSAWNNWGMFLPLTVLQIPRCQVVQVKTLDKEGYTSLQLGAGETKIKNTPRYLMGHFAKADVPPKRYLEEFRVTPEAILPLGTEITCQHFVPGQLVTITGTTKGRGFQGGVKRWGFHGGSATHGNSLSHRTIGATGARQDPGKVWKGKKMPGHMGSKRRLAKNLKIFSIYPRENLVCVVGSIPGAPGTFVRIADSLSNRFEVVPPFPTYLPDPKSAPQWKPFQAVEAKFKNPWRLINPDLQEDWFDSTERDETLKQKEQDIATLRKITGGVIYDYDKLYELGEKESLKYSALRGDEAVVPEDLEE